MVSRTETKVEIRVKGVYAIKPRTGQHSERPSAIFFGTIVKMPIEDFKAKMHRLTPNEVIDLLADQTYDNAKVVQQKTANVQQCIKWFHWGMALFLVFTIGRPILLSFVAA